MSGVRDPGSSRSDRILAALLARANARRAEREVLAMELNDPMMTPRESIEVLERFNRAFEAEREASDVYHIAVLAAEEGSR